MGGRLPPDHPEEQLLGPVLIERTLCGLAGLAVSMIPLPWTYYHHSGMSLFYRVSSARQIVRVLAELGLFKTIALELFLYFKTVGLILLGSKFP